MEATTERPEGHPDGAPPGAEASRGKADRYAYNADARAKVREDAPVTIGGQDFHRRRKSWEVTRELRALMRRQEKASSLAMRLRAQIDALTEKVRGIQDPDTGVWKQPPLTDEAELEQIDEKVDDLNERVDAAGLDADEAAFEMIALLLRTESGERPVIPHLKDSLDVEEAGELAGMLASGGEPLDEADPTPTPTSSDS